MTCAVFFLLFLGFASLLRQSVQDALSFCVSVLIPSLFPFLVVSDLFCQTKAIDALPKAITAPIKRIFACSDCGVGALLLGWLCGFPIGASVLAQGCKSNSCSKEEADRLLPYCTVCSPAFCILGIGFALFDSIAFGVILYLSQILCAILFGALFRPSKEFCGLEKTPEFSNAPSLSQVLPGSVAQGAQKMLSICAFVVFFQILASLLCHALIVLGVPSAVRALLCGFSELTQGVRMASAFSSAKKGAICGAVCLFGSLSVFWQVSYVMEKIPFSRRHYLLQKTFCALFGAILCAFAALLLF